MHAIVWQLVDIQDFQSMSTILNGNKIDWHYKNKRNIWIINVIEFVIEGPVVS